MAAAKKPVFHYFNLGSKGRGEVVRLFMTELGIDFEDKRYAYDETWQTKSKEFEEQGLTLTLKLPILEIDGHILWEHVPILRYLSRSVGAFDGVSNYDKYLVDAVSSIYVDWRAQWVANLGAPSHEYKTVTVPHFYSVWDRLYAKNSGPYLLGSTVTCADFTVFQALANNEAIGVDATIPPALLQMRRAMSERPNIKDYLSARATA